MKATIIFIFSSLIAWMFWSTAKVQPQPNFKQGLWAVQYNASFNKMNDYKWQSVPTMRYHYIDVNRSPEFKKLANLSSLPTIILYKNGKEIKRWEADITFKLNVKQNEIIEAAKLAK